MTTPSDGRTSDPFPASTQYTPVPNPLLAELLEEMDDVAELKLTLRIVWMLHRKRGAVKFVTKAELCSDRTVAAMLSAAGPELEGMVDAALSAAVARGTLLVILLPEGPDQFYLNTANVRSVLSRRHPEVVGRTAGGGPETWPDLEAALPRSSAFTAYEQNIGSLTPMVADRIREALGEHTDQDIVEAIKVAAESNKRSWKYVAGILRRWAEEGKPDGESRRDPQTPRTDEFIRRYRERQKARGNRLPGE